MLKTPIHPPTHPLCPHCGYDLVAQMPTAEAKQTQSLTCPECGSDVPFHPGMVDPHHPIHQAMKFGWDIYDVICLLAASPISFFIACCIAIALPRPFGSPLFIAGCCIAYLLSMTLFAIGAALRQMARLSHPACKLTHAQRRKKICLRGLLFFLFANAIGLVLAFVLVALIFMGCSMWLGSGPF